MVDVHYTCIVCDTDFIQEQNSPEQDEDIDMCIPCLEVILNDPSHGTSDDPWTKDLILEARGLA
jgi:hypothetical protein